MLTRLREVFKVVENKGFNEALNAIDGLNTVEINNVDIHGWTLLHHAVWREHTALVEKLIALGADPNIQSKKGSTALHVAAVRGNPKIIRILIRNSGNVDLKICDNMARTPLHIAMHKGFKKIIRLLVEYMNFSNFDLGSLDETVHEIIADVRSSRGD